MCQAGRSCFSASRRTPSPSSETVARGRGYQLLVQMRKAKQLSDGIVAFLAGRGGRAPSTVVVTHFAQQVAQAEASLFRHLLHQVRADPFTAEPSRYGQNPALPRPECGRLLGIGSPRDERRGVRLLSCRAQAPQFLAAAAALA